jgi:hypothetical protein
MISGEPSTPLLARLHDLDGPRTAEAVGREIREAIHLGEYVPGEVLRLRAIAERRRVRVTSLAVALASVERDGLLRLRGDVAVVAPLNLDELVSMVNMFRLVENDLLTRGCNRIDPTTFDALEAAIPDDRGPMSYHVALTSWSSQQRAARWRPIMTPTQGRFLASFQQASSRYVSLAMPLLADERGRRNEVFGWHRDLIERMRVGNIPGILEITHTLAAHIVRIGQLSVELYPSSRDEARSARAIPIRTAPRRAASVPHSVPG